MFNSMGEIREYLDHERIECFECGKSYINLGLHTRLAHEMDKDEYKLKYGIPITVGLVPKWRSEALTAHAIERVKTGEFGNISLTIEACKHRLPARPKTAWHQERFIAGGQRSNKDRKYPDSVFIEFCRRVSTGRTVMKVGADLDMPSVALLYSRCEENSEIKDALTKALKAPKARKMNEVAILIKSGMTREDIKEMLSTSQSLIIKSVGLKPRLLLNVDFKELWSKYLKSKLKLKTFCRSVGYMSDQEYDVIKYQFKCIKLKGEYYDSRTV